MKPNIKVAVVCASVAIGMIGMAYAAVPLYRLFCQATGYAGTPQRSATSSSEILERRIIVRFDANIAPGLDWEFRPVVNTMSLRIGETALAVFTATNKSDKPVVGTASFNVTPDQAGGFFNKIECFCFTEQRLEPGETVEMPVSFFVDPAIVKDQDGARIAEITLSYTFHPLANSRNGIAQRSNAERKEGVGKGAKGEAAVPRG